MHILAFALLFATHTPIPFDDARWRIDAKESRRESFQGRESLLLNNGTAWLEGVSFQDGIVEFDIATPLERGFHGLLFRVSGEQDYENVYIRPHLSGQPDAVQYQPEINGNSSWQIYATPGYTLPATFASNRWMHVKASFHGKRLEFSVDGQTMVFPDLVRPLARGKIGLASAFAQAHYANVIVRSDETEPAAGGDGAPAPEVPKGSVPEFRISSAFLETKLDPVKPLDRAAWSSLQWDTLPIASRGIANIGSIRKIEEKRNTVFAAVTLRAKTATTIRARFGFSDRVVAYLNGRPLFRGDDKYVSRDYRFLGTVGLYDELVLPLERGDNKLWFAVSEDFGGWAIALQPVEAAGVEVIAKE